MQISCPFKFEHNLLPRVGTADVERLQVPMATLTNSQSDSSRHGGRGARGEGREAGQGGGDCWGFNPFDASQLMLLHLN